MARLTTCGKQVKLDGQHLADARDEQTARAIATALEYAGVAIPREKSHDIEEILA